MAIFDIFVTVGIAAVLAAFIYIGRKLQILEDLKLTTEKIKSNVKVVSDYLTTTNSDFNHNELQSYSPFKLTDEGEKLIKHIQFDRVYKQHTQDFIDFIDSEHPKLKYDVERAAIKSISVLSCKDYMDFLKVFFYNNPDRNMKNTAPTLGIYVRDRYLETHLDISQ